MAPLWGQRPLLVCRGGSPNPQAWTRVRQQWVILVKGWNYVEEGFGGHWLSTTQRGTLVCLLWGNRPVVMPLEQHAAPLMVLTLIPRVYAMRYAVSPTQARRHLHLQHQYCHTGDGATARAWLATRELVPAFCSGIRPGKFFLFDHVVVHSKYIELVENSKTDKKHQSRF